MDGFPIGLAVGLGGGFAVGISVGMVVARGQGPLTEEELRRRKRLTKLGVGILVLGLVALALVALLA